MVEGWWSRDGGRGVAVAVSQDVVACVLQSSQAHWRWQGEILFNDQGN